jgi:hypothetical protein
MCNLWCNRKNIMNAIEIGKINAFGFLKIPKLTRHQRPLAHSLEVGLGTLKSPQSMRIEIRW